MAAVQIEVPEEILRLNCWLSMKFPRNGLPSLAIQQYLLFTSHPLIAAQRTTTMGVVHSVTSVAGPRKPIECLDELFLLPFYASSLSYQHGFAVLML
jgi:hypothetical protein